MQLTSDQQQIIRVFHYTQLFSTQRGDKNDSPLPLDLPKQWFHFLEDCLSVYVLSTLIVVLPIYFFQFSGYSVFEDTITPLFSYFPGH